MRGSTRRRRGRPSPCGGWRLVVVLGVAGTHWSIAVFGDAAGGGGECECEGPEAVGMTVGAGAVGDEPGAPGGTGLGADRVQVEAQGLVARYAHDAVLHCLAQRGSAMRAWAASTAATGSVGGGVAAVGGGGSSAAAATWAAGESGEGSGRGMSGGHSESEG